MAGFAVRFEAIALLMPNPKIGKASDLFDVTNLRDPKHRKKLLPDAATVKFAIAYFKKYGIDARYSGGVELYLAGPVQPLKDLFGLSVQIVNDRLALFDSSKTPPTPVRLFQPTNELSALIVALYLPDRAARCVPPTAPGQSMWWAKINSFHVWPHELASRLGAQPTNENGQLSAPAPPGYFRNNKRRDLGFGGKVSIVDSGIDTSHDYFSEGLGLDQADLNARFEIGEAAQAKTDTGNRLREFRSDLTIVQNALTALDNLMNGSGPQHIPPPTPAQTGAKAKIILESRIWILLSSWYVGDPVDNVRWNQMDGVESGLRKLQQGQLPAAFNFSPFLNWIVSTVRPWIQGLETWLGSFGNQPTDHDGHGTGMAASVLGIARNVDLAMYCGLIPGSILNEYQGFLSFNAFLEEAFDTAVEKVLTPGLDVRVAERRIVSNSWGIVQPMDDVRPTSVASAEIVRWSVKAGRATDAGCVVLFAAGNAGYPLIDYFSVQATTGPAGAIVVGGAYDSGLGTDLFLSTAAHGFDGPTGRIPDLCGIVGPEINNQSPYVYMPTRGNAWAWWGGGTSSATAQVAGVCAAIRTQFPSLGPGDIKDALITNGDAVKQGASYQKKKADSFSPFLTRVNIQKAFAKASAKDAQLLKKPKQTT